MLDEDFFMSGFPDIDECALNPSREHRLHIGLVFNLKIIESPNISPDRLQIEMLDQLPSSDSFHTGQFREGQFVFEMVSQEVIVVVNLGG